MEYQSQTTFLGCRRGSVRMMTHDTRISIKPRGNISKVYWECPCLAWKLSRRGRGDSSFFTLLLSIEDHGGDLLQTLSGESVPMLECSFEIFEKGLQKNRQRIKSNKKRRQSRKVVLLLCLTRDKYSRNILKTIFGSVLGFDSLVQELTKFLLRVEFSQLPGEDAPGMRTLLGRGLKKLFCFWFQDHCWGAF